MINNTQRNFIPGDEWLYYKIFCGYNSSDKILLDIIKPLSEFFLAQNIIEEWFFIRYNDPSYHLRYRIKIKDFSRMGQIILEINKSLHFFTENNFVWKIQIDTYTREVERYGLNSMEISEKIFFKDSLIISDILSSMNDNITNIRSLWGLKMIDFYLSTFNLTIDEKLNFAEKLRGYFYKEFDVEKNTKRQLDKIYTDNQEIIFQFLNTKKIKKTYLIKKSASEILNLKDSNLLTVDFNSLISSYIHMSINRLFVGDNRMHELITYDFIWRYYKKIYYFTINNSNQ